MREAVKPIWTPIGVVLAAVAIGLTIGTLLCPACDEDPPPPLFIRPEGCGQGEVPMPAEPPFPGWSICSEATTID